MKPTSKIILSAALLILSLSAISQCIKSKSQFCQNTPQGDYEYLGQSTYKELAPGSSITINTIFYSNYDYRIIVCGDPELGKANFSVSEEYKDSLTMAPKEKKLFDNTGNDLSVYDYKNANKTRKVVIRLNVPENANLKDKRCINVLIGSKYSRNKGYKKFDAEGF